MKSKLLRENQDITVSPEIKKLNIDIDAETLRFIKQTMSPNIVDEVPKGFYSAEEYEKILGVCRSRVCRKLNELKLKNKLEMVKRRKVVGNTQRTVPYYRIKH